MSSSHVLILIDWEESGFRLYTLKGKSLKGLTLNLANTFQTGLREGLHLNKEKHFCQDPQMTYWVYVALYQEAMKYLREECGVPAEAIGLETWSSFKLTLASDQVMCPVPGSEAGGQPRELSAEGILGSLLAAEAGRQPDKLNADNLLGLLNEIRTKETLGVYLVPYVNDWFSKTTIAVFERGGLIYLGCDSKHSEAYFKVDDPKGLEKEESKIHNFDPVQGVQVCFTYSGPKIGGELLSDSLKKYLENLDQAMGLPDPLQIAHFASQEVCKFALRTGKSFEIFLAIMMPIGYQKRAPLLFCISEKMMRPVVARWITGGTGCRMAGAVIERYMQEGQYLNMRPEDLLMEGIQGGCDRDSRSGGDIHILVLDQNNQAREETFNDEYFRNQDRNVKIADPNGHYMERIIKALESLGDNEIDWEVNDKTNTIVIRKAGGRFSRILLIEMILSPICYTENVVLEKNNNNYFDLILKY